MSNQICRVFMIGCALAIASAAHATEWHAECFEAKKIFLENPWAQLEVASGQCFYSDANDQQTGSIDASTLVATEQALKTAVDSLDAGGFGDPLVPLENGKPRVQVIPGDYLCVSQAECNPAKSIWGIYTEGNQGEKELFLVHDHLQSGTNTAHHEAFHAIEDHFDAFAGPDYPAPWISEGVAEGFAQTSARRLGLPYNPDGIKGDFTRSLDLRHLSKDEQVSEAYGVGEFWDFIGRERSPAGNYGFAHDLLNRSDLASGSGVAAVHEALKTSTGYSDGLRDAYSRFVALHLNDKRQNDLDRKVELNVRDSDLDEREETLSLIMPLATRGMVLEVEGEEGQQVELTIRVKAGTGSTQSVLTVDTAIEPSEYVVEHRLCGGQEKVRHVVRVANVGFKDDDAIVPTVEFVARVLDDDVCSCKVERLSIADEVALHAATQREVPRAYARVDVGGQRIVVADDATKGAVFYSTSVKVGERRHMGRTQYENFSSTEGQIDNRGLASRMFHFKAPGEGPGSNLCRKRDPSRRRPLFAPPEPEVDYCKVVVNDMRRGVSFVGDEGYLNVTQWNPDCWIEGNFKMFDSEGRAAEGVFAIDAGRAGIYDSRTKVKYQGTRFKSIAEIVDEGTFQRIEELKKEAKKAIPPPTNGSTPAEPGTGGPETGSNASGGGDSETDDPGSEVPPVPAPSPGQPD